jgi:flagellar biosynthesis/type III secretory pathway M-ring protein FliF/YscJ
MKQTKTPEQKKQADDKLLKLLIGLGILFVLIAKFTLYFIIFAVVIIGIGILLYSKRPKFKALVDSKLQKLNIFKKRS